MSTENKLVTVLLLALTVSIISLCTCIKLQDKINSLQLELQGANDKIEEVLEENKTLHLNLLELQEQDYNSDEFYEIEDKQTSTL